MRLRYGHDLLVQLCAVSHLRRRHTYQTLIQWNTNHTWITNAAKAWNCKGDARKVMTHELGHAHGLGHTGISPAVMRTGATTYWKPQANDKLGLQEIYGAYP